MESKKSKKDLDNPESDNDDSKGHFKQNKKKGQLSKTNQQMSVHQQKNGQKLIISSYLQQSVEDNQINTQISNHEKFAVPAIANCQIGSMLKKIELELLTENYFSENTKARTLWRKLGQIIPYVKTGYTKYMKILKELRFQLEQNREQIFAVGEKVMKFNKDLSIILSEKYLKRELKIMEHYCKKLDDYYKEIKDFKPFNEDQLQRFQEIQDEADSIIPVVNDDEVLSHEQFLFQAIQKHQQFLNEMNELKKGREFELSRHQITLKQLKQKKKTYKKEETFYLTQLQHLQDSIAMLNSFINDDGTTTREKIEQGRKELEEALKRIKEDEKKDLEESKKLFKPIHEKVQNQILKHFNLASFDMISQQKTNPLFPQGFHFIIMIDESGSVLPYKVQVTQGVHGFINGRKDFNKDKVSIIQFDDVARTTYTGSSITEKFNLSWSGKGTNFTNAFKQAQQELKLVGQKYQPVIIFMTDGLADSKQSERILTEMYAESLNRHFPLWTFCLSFNIDAKAQKTLDKLACAGNGGSAIRDVCGTQVHLSYVCENIESLLKVMQILEKKVVTLLDNHEVFFDQLQSRLTEVKEREKVNERKIQQDTQEEIKRAHDEYNNWLKLSTEKTEEQKQIHRETLKQREQEKQKINQQIEDLSIKQQDVEQKIKEQQLSIENIKKELNGAEYNCLKKQEESCDQATKIKEALNQQQKKLEAQENGFIGDTKMFTVQRLYIKQMNTEMPLMIDHMIIELRKSVELINDNFTTFVPRMKDIDEQKEDNIVIQQVALQILQEKDSDFSLKQELDSQDLSELIKYFLEKYECQKHELSEKIINFFLMKISDIQDLYYPINGVKPDEIQKGVKRSTQYFYNQNIKPFIDDIIEEEEDTIKVPDFKGSIKEKKAKLSEFSSELKQKGLYKSNGNLVKLLLTQIKIEECQEKLESDEVQDDVQREDAVKEQLEKLQLEEAKIQALLENPKKKELKDLLMKYYKDMRKDFSQKVQSFSQQNKRKLLTDQFVLMLRLLIEKINSLLEAIKRCEQG